MKRYYLSGIAVVAGAVLSALIGAGAASATELCSTATTPCSGTKYGSGTEFEASALFPSIKTSIGTVTCGSSRISGETFSAGGSGATAVLGELFFAELFGCTLSGTSCTASEATLSSGFSFTGGSASTTAAFKYNVTRKMGWHLECGFLINCTFTTSSAALSGSNNFGHQTIKAEEVAMAREGGLCPSSSTWNASYETNAPSPLYVV
ncbi:MAG TPA: hypothetical protein VNB59_06890 [Solirubrobacterales bacterium]|nr:hypothetical protein [Solirubrobacterales bacterium]